MQKDNKFFDDLAKAASGAAGSLMGMKREIEDLVAAQMEKFLGKMNLSTKEEVDTALAMMTKIREEQENIKNRLKALEERNG
jgi:BMFP domain-containing protein YqiC